MNTDSIHAHVNERLYYCRLHLDWYVQLLGQEEISLAVLQASMGESVAHHLRQAYRAYLAELSVCYLGVSRDFDSANGLSQALLTEGVQCAQISELLVLEAGDSWLSALLAAGSSPQTTDRGMVGKGDIPLQQLTSKGSTLDVTSLKTAFSLLKNLIDSQRAHSQEW